MFGLLSKVSQYNLHIDTALHLFNSIVKPILLYGSEVWGYSSVCNIQQIERVQLKFCKHLMKLNRDTPNAMVLGECGQFPIAIDVQIRSVMYWLKLKNGLKSYSAALLKMNVNRDWSNYVKDILNACGLSFVLYYDGKDIDPSWLKAKLSLCLKDQFLQFWNMKINESAKCHLYRVIKTSFGLENYFFKLPIYYRILYCKFRCGNFCTPSRSNFLCPELSRSCYLCNTGETGDDIHYVLYCAFFNEKRNQLLPTYFTKYPNQNKVAGLFRLSGGHLMKLCKLLNHIYLKLKASRPI